MTTITTIEQWRVFEAEAWYRAWRDRGLYFGSLDPDEREAVRAYVHGDHLGDAAAIVDRYVQLVSDPKLRDGER